MSRVEAEAECTLQPGVDVTPTRIISPEVELQVDAIPGIEPGKIHLNLQSLEDLKIVQQAIEDEDWDTIKEYIEEEG